jgi:ABC-type nitrate/sulfonate/bicarbonate transport system ATPase subunit
MTVSAVTRHPRRRTPRPSTLALQATDLDVAENDFITILGPSGCGKSTLLRIVAGLDGRPPARCCSTAAASTGPGADRGMVFQSYTLFPWLTCWTTSASACASGLPREQQLDIAQGFIAKVGLKGFERHYPKQLSGGMQQRTAIARALANDPRMLLMDEPFGALDHQTRELMQELLLGIWEAQRKTVLFVTHDIDEAVFMGSRVVVMSARPGPHQARPHGAAGAPAPLLGEDHAGLFAELKAELTERGGPRRGQGGAAPPRRRGRCCRRPS